MTAPGTPDYFDVCPSCRIQAPHRDGRTVCPRCGGQLVVQASRPVQPQPQPGRPRPAPAPRPTYQRPALRWSARRPPEARPAPRPPRTPLGPTPSYAANPGWGLIDMPPVRLTPTDPVDAPTDALTRAMRLTALVLAGAALAHGARYVVAVVNRSRPIPAWIDWLTSFAVLVAGIMSLVAVAMTLAAFGRWVLAVRSADYRSAAYTDPRHRLLVLALSVTPLVNVAGAPWMLHEAAQVGGDDADGRKGRIRIRLALAWALLNAFAVIVAWYRIAAAVTPSLQVDADALALMTLLFAVSAVFAHWARPRVERLAGRMPAAESATPRRLVAA